MFWFPQWLVLETSHLLEVVWSVVVLNMEKCIRTFWPFLNVDIFVAQMDLKGEKVSLSHLGNWCKEAEPNALQLEGEIFHS